MSRLGVLSTVLAAQFACAEDLALRHRDYLLGDLNGVRPWFSDRGFELDLVYTSDLLWNVHGGLDTGSEYRADLSLYLALETEQAGWWDGGAFFAHLQAQHGDGLTETKVGDFQVLSNIDADDFAQISEMWYRHTWDDGRLWIKLGKQDANADFAFVEYGGEFINSSPGFSPTIPLVTYPDPDWGIALGMQPVEWFSLTAGIFHGRPDGGRSIGNTIDNLYGPMLMVEPAFHYDVAGRPGHLRFGLWWNGDRFDRLTTEQDAEATSLGERAALLQTIRARGLAAAYVEGLVHTAAAFVGDAIVNHARPSETKDETYGYYVTWDQLVYAEDADDDHGVGVFAQFGYSDDELFEAERYFGVGAQWVGPFPSRDEDILGLGVFYADFSEHAGFEEAGETVVEIYYRAQLTPWFSLKPDVQFINHPGGRNGHAWVVGFRTELSF